MPQLPPSEFDGQRQRNGIAPPITPRGKAGHVPTNSEKLRLLYLTGQDEDSTVKPDNGEAFNGLLPLAEAEKINPPPEQYLK